MSKQYLELMLYYNYTSVATQCFVIMWVNCARMDKTFYCTSYLAIVHLFTVIIVNKIAEYFILYNVMDTYSSISL